MPRLRPPSPAVPLLILAVVCAWFSVVYGLRVRAHTAEVATCVDALAPSTGHDHAVAFCAVQP